MLLAKLCSRGLLPDYTVRIKFSSGCVNSTVFDFHPSIRISGLSFSAPCQSPTQNRVATCRCRPKGFRLIPHNQLPLEIGACSGVSLDPNSKGPLFIQKFKSLRRGYPLPHLLLLCFSLGFSHNPQPASPPLTWICLPWQGLELRQLNSP